MSPELLFTRRPSSQSRSLSQQSQALSQSSQTLSQKSSTDNGDIPDASTLVSQLKKRNDTTTSPIWNHGTSSKAHSLAKFGAVIIVEQNISSQSSQMSQSTSDSLISIEIETLQRTADLYQKVCWVAACCLAFAFSFWIISSSLKS